MKVQQLYRGEQQVVEFANRRYGRGPRADGGVDKDAMMELPDSPRTTERDRSYFNLAFIVLSAAVGMVAVSITYWAIWGVAL